MNTVYKLSCYQNWRVSIFSHSGWNMIIPPLFFKHFNNQSFRRTDHAPIRITLNGQPLISKTSINVLGVVFDSKLTWSEQVNKSINKSKKALHAVKPIQKYFTRDELKGLLTSNFYSVLYYNSEIWHLPTLNPHLKQKLLSASANALKVCLTQLPINTSFESIHRLAKRATPNQMSDYKHALQTTDYKHAQTL